ncbi:hypothetical protein KAR91_25585 [Candidatus Pacearchaeota archaeon]|nr:hypothetical protein [Candidatus Pacearchaeota archaeon]
MKGFETLKEDKAILESEIKKLIDKFVHDYNGIEINISIDLFFMERSCMKGKLLTGSKVNVGLTI